MWEASGESVGGSTKPGQLQLAYQDEICASFGKGTGPVKDTTGYTLFPGDEAPAEIDFIGPTAGQEEAKFWQDNTSEIALFVLGCISYTDDRHDRIHTTPFVYRVLTLSEDGKSYLPIGPSRKSVEAPHVLLTPDFTASPD